MLKKDVKKGTLVWWKAKRNGYRCTKRWDCPGVITEVRKLGYTIVTFDDFGESNASFAGGDDGPAHKEMRLATKEEVKYYVEERKEDAIDKFIKVEREHNKKLRDIDRKFEEMLNL